MRIADRQDVDFFRELANIYMDSAQAIQKELFAFFQQYATDNQITWQEARKKLLTADLSDYRRNAERYFKQAKEEKDEELLQRLNEQYRASRATRLDVLHLALVYQQGVLHQTIEKNFDAYLKKLATYSYRKAAGGLGVTTLNAPALHQLVKTPFNGYNYSQQVWGNIDHLGEHVRETFKKGFIRGSSVQEMALDLRKQYQVAQYRAETLVRTDGTMIINNATAERYKNAGLRYYRIHVHLDSRTTEICKTISRQDQRYPLSELQTGLNAPPFHYNCRSTIVPDGEELSLPVDKEGNVIQPTTDNMAKKELFKLTNAKGEEISFHTKPAKGTDYNIRVENHAKRYRDTVTTLNRIFDEMKREDLPPVVVVDEKKLGEKSYAGYNRSSDVLYVSTLLGQEERLEKRVKGNYFAAKDAKGVIVHELAHKAHWDAVKRLQKQSPKRYNSIEKAKKAFDEPIRKHIATQLASDPMYLVKLSRNANEGYKRGPINEVIAEIAVNPGYDTKLMSLVQRET